MYTEEVGVSPLAEHGGSATGGASPTWSGPVARTRGSSTAGRVQGRVAVVTQRTAQVQGVWVDPAFRGRGIATGGMAAVVRDALLRVAPTVSLYVNDFNEPARRIYARCGFRRAGTFATVLFSNPTIREAGSGRRTANVFAGHHGFNRHCVVRGEPAMGQVVKQLSAHTTRYYWYPGEKREWLRGVAALAAGFAATC